MNLLVCIIGLSSSMIHVIVIINSFNLNINKNKYILKHNKNLFICSTYKLLVYNNLSFIIYFIQIIGSLFGQTSNINIFYFSKHQNLVRWLVFPWERFHNRKQNVSHPQCYIFTHSYYHAHSI